MSAPSPVAETASVGPPANFAALETYLAPLRQFLEAEITELCINGPGEVWVESAAGWERHAVPELTAAHLMTLATLCANASSQAINKQNPVLSAPLPRGERVQVVIPPAASQISITIRKPSKARYTLAQYEASGFFEHARHTCISSTQHAGLRKAETEMLALLAEGRVREFFEAAVENKLNMVVSGATGSGKTTFMKSLADLIPSVERLVTIEDTAELSLSQPNVVRLFYSKDDQGVSKATPKSLLESCLRMKPDRILLAELRGEEAFYYVRNVNSGHPGSITSLHAGSELLAFEQLILLIKESEAGRNIDRADLKQLLFSLVDVVVQVGRVNGRRGVSGIYYDPTKKLELVG